MSTGELHPSADTPTVLDARPAHQHPRQIGPYKILSVLGEGGMGIVYAAEQRSPVHRTVALKIIKLGMDTRDVVARFEAERQALAMMDHPSVARVYDAGSTETGRPYFAMELVRGVPITSYCDDHRLTTRQRLELFIDVCEAVQHAHMKGVIHRDLKPTNVLVVEVNGKPVPKVIDFGVAKAISHRLTERTLFTEHGQLVGTPEYMSPEQAEKAGLDVDTRTDVYSLGVMLYELLTGTLPFDSSTLRMAGYGEIQRIIRETDPPRPSTRLSRLGRIADHLAERRQESAQTLTGMLRRELEWIPLRAMRKDRTTRYASAAELAEDLRRYLDGRPLRAAPESTIYRMRKFVRRNRVPVATAAMFVLLLFGGIVATTVQAIRATRAEHRERDRAADVRRFANKMIFDLHGDIEKLPGSAPAVRKLMTTSLAYLDKIGAETSNDPEVIRDCAVAYMQLGDIQGNPNTNNTGDTVSAIDCFRRAKALAERGVKIDPKSLKARQTFADVRLKLADMMEQSGDYTSALREFQVVHDEYEALARSNPADFVYRHNALITLSRIANAQRQTGESAGAVATYRKQLDGARRLVADFRDPKFATDARDFLGTALGQLGIALNDAGDSGAALAVQEEAVGVKEELCRVDPDNANFRWRLCNGLLSLADTYDNLDRKDKALESQMKALEIIRRMIRADPDNARLQTSLGQGLLRFANLKAQTDRLDDAAKSYGEAIDVYQRILKTSPNDRSAQQMLIVTYGDNAELLAKRGDVRGALREYQKTLDLLAPLVTAEPGNHILVAGIAYSQSNMGRILIDHDEPAQALAYLRPAVETNERIAAADPANGVQMRNTLEARVRLADALVGAGATKDVTREQRQSFLAEARDLYARSRDGFTALRDKRLLPPALQDVPDQITRKLTALDAPTTRP
jgi:serine/threonine protein kinase